MATRSDADHLRAWGWLHDGAGDAHAGQGQWWSPYTAYDTRHGLAAALRIEAAICRLAAR